MSSPPALTPGGSSVSASLTGKSAPLTAPETTSTAPEFALPVNPDFTEVSNWTAEFTEQAVTTYGPEVSDPSTPLSTIEHPALAEFSSLLGKFAGTEMNLKVSGNESQGATAPEKPSPGSAPQAAGALSGSLPKAAMDSLQNPAAPKSENLVNNPLKGAIHSAPVPGSSATATGWLKDNETEAASGQALHSFPASPVASPQPDPNSQPATAVMTLHEDPAPEANGIQPNLAASPNSGESAAHANLSDATTGGQGKSGQQSGPSPGDNPTGIKTFPPNLAGNPSADSAASLLTANTPSVAVSHANPPSPQTPQSSSQPPTTLSAWQDYDGGAGKIVRSAWLSDSASGAEMHVELRSAALGPLEVHTVVHEGSVGAEIHVEGQEAHTLLAAGLPSLERALGERNLRVENVAVYQDHVGGGMSGGGKQDSQSDSSPTPQRQVLLWDNPPQPRSAASNILDDEEFANPAAGLSVRA
jgi:hypothetical protein